MESLSRFGQRTGYAQSVEFLNFHNITLLELKKLLFWRYRPPIEILGQGNIWLSRSRIYLDYVSEITPKRKSDKVPRSVWTVYLHVKGLSGQI
jgi:hypothetical protein